MIVVGPKINVDASKIEASKGNETFVDVSYVDGFTIPVTCSSEGVVITGCNIDLFKQPGIMCHDKIDGPLCLNPARWTPDGPALPFFAACAGAAYTYVGFQLFGTL
jgi:hypothetical protein